MLVGGPRDRSRPIRSPPDRHRRVPRAREPVHFPAPTSRDRSETRRRKPHYRGRQYAAASCRARAGRPCWPSRMVPTIRSALSMNAGSAIPAYCSACSCGAGRPYGSSRSHCRHAPATGYPSRGGDGDNVGDAMPAHRLGGRSREVHGRGRGRGRRRWRAQPEHARAAPWNA